MSSWKVSPHSCVLARGQKLTTEPSITKCPLLIHLALPPLPQGVRLEDVLRYDSELANPTGLLFSLKKPPTYWQGVGLGGVIVGDQCGFVAGLDRGRGVPLDDFWRKTINCKVADCQ